MRTIKFRAWFANWKQMHYNDKGENYNVRISLDGTITGLATTQKPILMQFTGLLDKNGKEIFEGDIVKYNVAVTGRYQSFERYGTVVWYDKDASFRYHDTVKGIFREILVVSSTEIIGNIYETPNLITQ